MYRIRVAIVCVSLIASFALTQTVRAQSYGTELHNTLMPASGGMGGTSAAMPQDLTSAINGNPATLTQFPGTQFMMGGFWAEPTYVVGNTGGVLPNVGAFEAKSSTQGSAGANIGVTQDFSALGMPCVVGLGLTTAAGGGTNFTHVPASNGTSSELVVLEITAALGIDLTDRLSAGASVSLGTAFYDGLFVGQSSMTLDYALRGSIGLTYQVAPCTTLGLYYQTKQGFTFDNAIRLEIAPNVYDPFYLDVNMDLPTNIVLGLANTSLMDGRLLLAADVIYKRWGSANLYRAIYDDQWVFQLGAQYSTGPWRLRAGYAYAQNPLQANPGVSAGGVTVGTNGLQYVQSQLAVINQHRVSMGIGRVNVLPGIDFDMFVGGMFEDSQQLGASFVSVESYWLGAGLTWRFGRGSCQRVPAPHCW